MGNEKKLTVWVAQYQSWQGFRLLSSWLKSDLLDKIKHQAAEGEHVWHVMEVEVPVYPDGSTDLIGLLDNCTNGEGWETYCIHDRVDGRHVVRSRFQL